jgi:Tfp pilus assembly protein PilF
MKRILSVFFSPTSAALLPSEVIEMRTRMQTVAWLLVLLSMVPGLAFGQRLRLTGRIIDPSGKPIEGVEVTATSPDVPAFREVETTDKKGSFTIDLPRGEVDYTYKFVKAGYVSLEAKQHWSLEGSQRFDWTMQPGASTAADAATPAVTTSEPAVTAYNAGVAALKAKDARTAEAKFNEAVGLDPKMVPAWVALTTVQVQMGHNKEAAESAEKAMALGSKDAAMLTARWQAYKNLRDTDKAAAALKDLEVIGRSAEEAKKFHNEGVALAKAGDAAGALGKFQEALNLDPTLRASMVGLATAALKLGKNAEAATAAESILKLDPRNDQALRLRYNACLVLGDPDRLFDALIGLAAVEPTVAKNGMLKLAFDAYDGNDKAKAKARFQKVLDVDPNQPQAHYYLALVLVADGNTAEAKAHLEKFVALAPNATEAANARDMLKQLK